MKHLNWDDLRLLLLIVQEGTLRRASKKAGMSPATLSRRLDDLEEAVGQKLVERFQAGCLPTAFGADMVALASQMGEIALEVERTRDRQDAHAASGVVRINTDEWLSYFLTTRFARFHDAYPNVEVEIVTSHRPYSLARREADIALRPYRPEQLDLVTRCLGTLSFGLYCSRDVAERHAAALSSGDWARVPFVGFDEPRAEFQSDRWLRALPGAPAPWMRCSYGLGILDGVSHGAGLGVLATFLAGDQQDLVAAIPHIPELDQEIWLSMHASLRTSARIRAVVDFMGQVFAAYRETGR
ncbi:LysR family transcriptional regulator [Pseudoduganella lutea]|uniref:LysR family transcriptional regulator n=1 Tax=Pseudoduganella lutea TaxID=321985 RepID=A0A4P6L338_9BURK|nr:LysR family transcriptional regulator [Pseudoduganella lutea]QBE65861.1 LysR family transcriptional regulator [Pseudoduganella lutea]